MKIEELDEFNECVDCPKDVYSKMICAKRNYPYNHAKLEFKDMNCNCVEKMKLIKNVNRGL